MNQLTMADSLLPIKIATAIFIISGIAKGATQIVNAVKMLLKLALPK